jgi:outer membrane protein TolC
LEFTIKILLIVSLWALLLPRDLSSAVMPKGISNYHYKPISLKAAIQQGVQKNHAVGMRDHQRGILNLSWQGQWSAFWLPSIDLTMSVDPYRILRIRNSTDLDGAQSKHTGGGLALTFGEYSVFNWGKDYMAYLNNKQIFKRGLQSLTESDRQLKFDIITNYSNLVTQYQVLATQKLFLRHASYVYKLTKEKIAAKKISGQEYYQTRVLYMKAYQAYLEAKRRWINDNEKLAFLIDDEPSTRYILNEELKFIHLEKELVNLTNVGRKNSPQVLSAFSQKKVAQRSYEIARRENMALPDFKINLGAFTQSYNTGQSDQFFGNFSGNKNLEVTASLTATWNIVGVDGFLNNRKLQNAHLQRQLSTRSLKRQEDMMSYLISNYYHQVKNYEKQVKLSIEQESTAESAYNITFNNYTLRKTSFLNFLHSLQDLTSTKVGYLERKRDHLNTKVQLASVVGIPDFPGNLFENHVSKITGSKNSTRELAPEEIETDPYYQGEQ